VDLLVVLVQSSFSAPSVLLSVLEGWKEQAGELVSLAMKPARHSIPVH
jgi:hypothetical protein